MAVAKTFSSDSDPTAEGLALTYIVPTAACDLKCPFCFIAQRHEATPVRLTPEDYAVFISDVAACLRVRVSGIQGYEALLPDSWLYTKAILEASNAAHIPTSLVTNGTHLAERAYDLEMLGLRDLTISLDSVDPDIHDHLRGVPGTFERTILGIRAALAQPELSKRLCVAAVLFPNRRKYIDTLPAYLAQLGVPYFGVTPLLRVGHDGKLGGMHQEDQYTLMQDLEILHEECEKEGVHFVTSDELHLLKKTSPNQLLIHRLKRPNRLLRLAPSGNCAVGIEVLQQMEIEGPRWNPSNELPRDFLKRLGITPELF